MMYYFPKTDFWGDQNDSLFIKFVSLSFKLNKAQKRKPWKNFENILNSHVPIK